ncbi:hypothetical protein SETIT_6G221000v2 [Setaria italica]|uniref:Uncharacterized protein n=1 Tax=Setaria italica TaxID=4555 RepID=A0A368RPE0_SETIT|nr:hypothetical protein SETIT_6G221000v2 [Setaria italica]
MRPHHRIRYPSARVLASNRATAASSIESCPAVAVTPNRQWRRPSDTPSPRRELPVHDGLSSRVPRRAPPPKKVAPARITARRGLCRSSLAISVDSPAAAMDDDGPSPPAWAKLPGETLRDRAPPARRRRVRTPCDGACRLPAQVHLHETTTPTLMMRFRRPLSRTGDHVARACCNCNTKLKVIGNREPNCGQIKQFEEKKIAEGPLCRPTDGASRRRPTSPTASLAHLATAGGGRRKPGQLPRKAAAGQTGRPRGRRRGGTAQGAGRRAGAPAARIRPCRGRIRPSHPWIRRPWPIPARAGGDGRGAGGGGGGLRPWSCRCAAACCGRLPRARRRRARPPGAPRLPMSSRQSTPRRASGTPLRRPLLIAREPAQQRRCSQPPREARAQQLACQARVTISCPEQGGGRQTSCW